MDLMGVKAAAAFLGIAEGTLRYWRSVGDEGPPSFKIGRKVFYDRAELDRWIAQQKAATMRGGKTAAVG